ncbi:asparagine synthase C-terminal domain-containing protein [Brevundimonas sp. SL130]|uniref:asparagine synthase C-terminal domain-containing protein n=1 Tax=Brevundimonas sp. SL130 TaxID=2995143 RepID=UPI00226D274A|nr:asparagine synthase C-terminal domain-containing protein [Brevundimonas sp. SL130]WAC61368.1 asparagine synthase C-terminal domain-containing protein [Brevundimonas sp. SL130]
MPSPYVLISAPQPALEARARHLADRAQRAGWTLSRLDPGVWLATPGGGEPAVVRVGPWRLIGRVIPRRAPRFAAAETDPHRFEHGLLARFWGAYVGVRVGTCGATALLRDVGGGLDCVVWEDAGLTLAASAPPAWLEPARSGWRIAWPRVGAALHDPLSVWEDLLLDGPVAVGPGALQPLPLTQPPIRLWRPINVARRGAQPATTPAEAAARLRESLDEAVEGLAAASPDLAAEVSGGLDSSLVAGSLRAVGAPVRLWLNLYTDNPDGDERAYAQALADHLSFPLETLRHSAGAVTPERLAAVSGGFRPGLNALDPAHDALWASRLRQAGATAVMTGRGGDSILVQAATGDIVTDLWRAQGPMALFHPALPRLAALDEVSVWDLVAQARSWRPRAAATAIRAAPFVSAPRPEASSSPWLQPDSAALGPAKALQIAGVLDGVGRQSPSPSNDAIEALAPLLSQPVVETCLALPAWILAGDRDRGLARLAFADRLPDLIRLRRSKGHMTSVYGRMLAAGLPRLRPWLLDGVLAQQGLIDRTLAEAALTPEALAWRGGYGEIMITLALEAWARSWSSRLEAR